jgi:hypothetical protein
MAKSPGDDEPAGRSSGAGVARMELEIGKVRKIRADGCYYYSPNQVDDIVDIYPEIKEFHTRYFDGTTPDLPLGYIVCNNGNMYAISVYAHDYGVDIDIVDVLEWLSNDP